MEKQVEMEMDGRTPKEVLIYKLYLRVVFRQNNVLKARACFHFFR